MARYDLKMKRNFYIEMTFLLIWLLCIQFFSLQVPERILHKNQTIYVDSAHENI